MNALHGMNMRRGDRTSNLIGTAISGPGHLSLSHRLRIEERIHNIIAHESDPVTGLCQSCSARTRSVMDKEYTSFQHEVAMFTSEDFGFKQDVNIYGVLDQSEDELREQIKQASDELSLLARTEEDIRRDMAREAAAIDDLNGAHARLLTDLNLLERKREDLSEKIAGAMELTWSAERELQVLHTLDAVPLFYLSAAASAPRINGFGLSLYPSRANHSNYAEINTAWGLIGLAVYTVICLRCSFDQGALSPDLNYKLTPLRNRVILRRIKYIKMKNSNDTAAFLGPVLNLEGGVSDTYLESIAALIVLLASLSRKLNRLDALTGVLGRVLDTVDKYGADVASSSFGGGFQHNSVKVSSPAPMSGLELLPHWRYLFSSSANTLPDVMKALQILL